MMLQNVGYAALLLGVLVFVHEFGHFLVAKACGVKVLKFSIGFGPRVIGFTRGETEYCISLLPMGGYVKMAGDIPGEAMDPADARRGFLSAQPWKRALIVGAGPFFNLVFPILVYFFVLVGMHQVLAPTVGSVDAGTPAAGKLQPGDRILAVDGQPVRTFEEMRKKVQPRLSGELPLSVDRNGQHLELRITPMRSTETNPIESVQHAYLGISAQARPAMVGVPPGSPAERAGLKTFDRITALDGAKVESEVDLERALAKANKDGSLQVTFQRLPPGEPQTAVSSKPDGKPPKVEPKVEASTQTLTLPRQPGAGYAALGAESSDPYVYQIVPGTPAAAAGIQPGDRLVSLNGEALPSFRMFLIALGNLQDKPFQLGWRHGAESKAAQLQQVKREIKNEMGIGAEQLDLGAEPRFPKAGEVPDPEWVSLYTGPWEALVESAHIVPEFIGKIALVIAALFTGHVPFKTVGGPVMLYQLASKSAEQGWETYLSLMAGISINLGMMNLLPIPALDGFQLLASIWEGVRRRPIPARSREIANAVGLAMLVVLMILVFKNDLTR